MVKVYAPASIGNVGVGFDVLGMAITPITGDLLGDYVSVENSDVFNVQNTGLFCDQLPNQLEQNIVFQCWKVFSKELEGKERGMRPFSIQLEKNVPVGSGLGSSACSIVATLMAMNCHCGYPLNDNQLLDLMGKMEGKISGTVHFDNVSSCFLGGMRLILQKCEIITQTIPVFNDWLWVMAYPGIDISTIIAREVLPEQYDRKDCITYGRNIAGFVHACYTKQEWLAVKCMQDIIAEPYRAKLLPVSLSYIRRMLIEKGAIACGISGSGPTIFVLCDTSVIAHDIANWLENVYLQNHSGFVRICTLDTCGARVI